MRVKKIVLGFNLVPNDNSVTLESLKEVLAKLGNFSVFAHGEVVVGPVKEVATKEVTIWISAGEDEPYYLVDGHSIVGRELSDQEVASLRFFGVCTKFYATYPRPDLYGAPFYASCDALAEAEVSGHLFVVDAQGLDVKSRSSGDDSGESIWLTIAIPEALHATLTGK